MKENKFNYMVYLQRFNGYWEREPYDTLEEIQYLLDSLDDQEYLWYIVVDKRNNKDESICSGRVHTKEEYKPKKRRRNK